MAEAKGNHNKSSSGNVAPRHQNSSRNSAPRGASGGSGGGSARIPRIRQISEADLHGMGDKTCIVCYKDVKYFSVGPCDHSVCFECSSRMRVLMEQNECPICRQKIEHVRYNAQYLKKNVVGIVNL